MDSAGRPGIDIPDRRGRTGLDHEGMGLDRNPNVRVKAVDVTSDGWHVLRRTTFDYRDRRGNWDRQERETYDRGNGAVILLYDEANRTVLLGRQFRYPTYVNDHPDGMLIECAAGLLDGDDPESAIRREAEEELGVTVGAVTPVFESYMSPGSVTERLHFFAAPYTQSDRRHDGGGLAHEGEDIEVIEITIDDAHAMIRNGEITDGKTIMLIQWALLDGPFRDEGGQVGELPSLPQQRPNGCSSPSSLRAASGRIDEQPHPPRLTRVRPASDR